MEWAIRYSLLNSIANGEWNAFSLFAIQFNGEWRMEGAIRYSLLNSIANSEWNTFLLFAIEFNSKWRMQCLFANEKAVHSPLTIESKSRKVHEKSTKRASKALGVVTIDNHCYLAPTQFNARRTDLTRLILIVEIVQLMHNIDNAKSAFANAYRSIYATYIYICTYTYIKIYEYILDL